MSADREEVSAGGSGGGGGGAGGGGAGGAVCVWGLLLEKRVVCYSLMHQHSTHLDPNPTVNSKTNTHTHTHWSTHTPTHPHM